MNPQKKSSAVNLVRKELKLNFRRRKLLEAALYHPSYRNENKCGRLENFDRLEFFGDALLNYIVCQKLYRVFPDADEGLMSRLRSILVSRRVLSRIAKKIRLTRVFRIGNSLVREKNHSKAKILADGLEALIAAYYFDRGLPAAKKCILNWYEGYFDSRKLLRIDPNPKSTLQELAQKNWRRLPVYVTKMTASGAKTTVMISPSRKASGSAKIKREAEENAARNLIRKLRQELVRRSKKKSSARKLLKAA